MKKILLTAAVLLSSFAAFAQHEVGAFTLQPKIGLNIANVTDMDYIDPDPRVGFVGGVEAEYQATDIFSISAGALYSMQGAKASSSGNTATMKVDYINIPIMANVYIVKGLAVKLGIQPGINVNAEGEVDYGSGSRTDDVRDNVESIDLSIPVGLSYEFNNIVLDARYNWGVTPGCKKEAYGFTTKSKNSVFQITLGYKFEL